MQANFKLLNRDTIYKFIIQLTAQVKFSHPKAPHVAFAEDPTCTTEYEGCLMSSQTEHLLSLLLIVYNTCVVQKSCRTEVQRDSYSNFEMQNSECLICGKHTQ